MRLSAGFLGVMAALVAMSAAADDVMPAGLVTQKTVYGDVLAVLASLGAARSVPARKLVRPRHATTFEQAYA